MRRSILAAVLAAGLCATALYADPLLESAFLFGSRNLTCATHNEPGTNYTMVHHAANSQAAHDALAYDAARGWGFVVTDPGNTGRNGGAQFGPFDDSPNNRNAFDDTCPDEIYDSFIGAKNYTNECSEATIGDADTPCSPTIPAEGLIFRIDLPNGVYRFVGAFGDASNRHAHRVIVEDGGSGGPNNLGPNNVVLVHNFNQAEHGAGVFAHVGFGSHIAPPGDGVGNDPQFVNMGRDGRATAGLPDSPFLEVTQGYIRVHLLQANSNDGAAGSRDPNGTDIVLFETWKIGDLQAAFAFGSRNLDCPTGTLPGVNYTMVHHINDEAGYDAIAYDAARGYGFEELYDPSTSPFGSRNTSGRFGPFDDSPNNRNAFGDDCPEEIYDSFIGAKNYTNECSEATIGDPDTPCSPTILAEGLIFRVDVPNGLYRFAGAFGDASNRHAHRVLAEDGGSGTPDLIGPNHVVLVSNYNQAEYGTGNFARVGFDGVLPPEADGPQFTNMDENGLVSGCPANSPILEVTQGYVRFHLLQANSNDGAAGARDANGTDVVLLELWEVPTPVISPAPAFVNVTRDVQQNIYTPNSTVDVTLTAVDVVGPTRIEEIIPAGWMIVDAGTGTPTAGGIDFNIVADGSVSYSVMASDACDVATWSGTVFPEGGCTAEVGGQTNLGCVDFRCTPDAEALPPTLEGAFAFGARNLTCETFNVPGVDYTMVHHAANSQAAHDALAYDAGLGYGFEIIDPGNTDRNGGAQFGPFDDSPNNRNRFGNDCPEELYDSFIGFKNHAQTCNEDAVGNTVDPCLNGMSLPDDSEYIASGGVFRIDVPNGIYRFVAAIGESDNPHAHRVLVEDGGAGPPDQIGPNHVALIENFDQAQQDIGEAEDNCLGCGVFARVGFNCRIPPLGDGVTPDPQFVDFGPDGRPIEGPPESPILEVTQGYIRVHLLQGNSNDGPGGGGLDPVTGIGSGDPNGTDIVVFEAWSLPELPGLQIVGDCNQDGTLNIADVVCEIGLQFPGFVLFGAPGEPCDGTTAQRDVNGDGASDLSDIVFLANHLFGGGPPPQPEGCAPFEGCDDNVSCD